MSNKIILSFVFGLILGIGIGYILTDYHYRKMELKTEPPLNTSNNPMDEVHKQIQTLKDILEKNPRDYVALVSLGNLHYDINQFEKAIPFYERAIEIKRDPNVIADLGTCYRETGNPNFAIKLYEEAYKIDNKHWRSVYNIIIINMHDLKDQKKAKEYLEILKKLNPEGINLESLEKAIENIK